MQKWNTLAVSDYGVHENRFKEEMTYEEAVRVGKEECKKVHQKYVGTYSDEDIGDEVAKVRTQIGIS